jgi:hypothetical protein
MIAILGRTVRSSSANVAGSVVDWIVRDPVIATSSAAGPPSARASQVGSDGDVMTGR